MAQKTKGGQRTYDESDLAGMKLDDLRSIARDQGVGGVSSMRKDDLVHTLAKDHRRGSRGSGSSKGGAGSKSGASAGDGARKGSSSAKSLKYAEEVMSPEQAPSRPGRTLVTISHDVIQQWADERNAAPATIEGTEKGDRVGVLTFDFPGYKGGGRLKQVVWDEWFRTFDTRQLNFLYQEQKTDGTQSNFFRLENPDREDA